MTVVKFRLGDTWVPVTGGNANIWDTAWGVLAVGSFIPPFAPHVVSAVETITYPLTAILTAGRRFRVYFQVRAVQPTGAAGNISFWLRDNGVEVRATPYGGDPYIYSAGAYTAGSFEWLLNGDNASHTIEIKAGPSGSHNVYTDYGLFYIEDIGPIAGSPSLPSPPPAWNPVTFLNGWVNYGSGFAPAAYRKIGDIVYLRGLLMGGTVGAVVCNLPVGFRPAYQSIFAVDGNPSQHVRCDVGSNGNVIFVTGNNLHTSLEGIQFSTTA